MELPFVNTCPFKSKIKILYNIIQYKENYIYDLYNKYRNLELSVYFETTNYDFQYSNKNNILIKIINITINTNSQNIIIRVLK